MSSIFGGVGRAAASMGSMGSSVKSAFQSIPSIGLPSIGEVTNSVTSSSLRSAVGSAASSLTGWVPNLTTVKNIAIPLATSALGSAYSGLTTLAGVNILVNPSAYWTYALNNPIISIVINEVIRETVRTAMRRRIFGDAIPTSEQLAAESKIPPNPIVEQKAIADTAEVVKIVGEIWTQLKLTHMSDVTRAVLRQDILAYFDPQKFVLMGT